MAILRQVQSDKRMCLVCQLAFVGTTKKCPNDGTPLVLISDPLIGSFLDQGYQIIEQVGRGAMGSVYKANGEDGEIVAVKVLHKSLVGELEPVRRFQMEAELTSRLSHRNIITVDDFGVLEDGRPYMIMDYIEGECINDIVDAYGPLSLQEALPIFIQVAQALGYAHEQNIIHRDVKLSNIMLINLPHQRNVVKLVDFGIAKQLTSDCSFEDQNGLTDAGQVVGSPLYMSPEQCMGQALDHRTDIYSLGCVMYYALTGRPVFTAESIMQLMRHQIARPPQPLRTLTSSVSEEVEKIVLKALAKRPEDRYQSMNEMVADLEQALDRVSPLHIVAA